MDKWAMPGNLQKPVPFLKIPSALYSPLHLQTAAWKDNKTNPGNLQEPCLFGNRGVLNRKVLTDCVEKKNQLDVTECFIALMICSTCFGHFYAHL